MKHTVYIIDKLFDSSPIFFNEFKDAYPRSLNLLFRNDEKSDFEIYVEKISITLLSKRNLSKENDVVLCLANTTPLDKSLIYIPFLEESKDVEDNQFPQLNAFYIPQVSLKDFSTYIHDLTFTILSRLGIDHFHRKVFISYRRGEREKIALNLFRDLASDRSGFEVFLDTRKLDIGIDFMDDIRRAISETDVFILLYSETYMTKPFTQKEFYTALTAGIGIILLYEGSEDETFKKDRLCPKGLPTLFYTLDSDGKIPQDKLEELVNMMNIERQYFKERKMRRFLRLTKNLEMNSMYSWINPQNKIDNPEYVYPLYCLPSSLDLQRIEDGITDNKGKHIIIYDHWPIPEFYNSNIRWIMKDKNITLKTLQECFIPNVQINNNTEMTGKKPIVFLSASIPDGKNEHNYIFADIHEIIVTLVEEIINRKGKLVFGGHPTITPIIANMMNLYKQKNIDCYPDITLYQSAYFENQFPPEVNEFPEERRKFIEKGNNLDESLKLMRERILNDVFFTHAVFIGGNIKEDGTCGVWTECERFHAKYPKAKCIAFNNTGTDLERIKMIASESFVSPTSIDEFTCLFDKE